MMRINNYTRVCDCGLDTLRNEVNFLKSAAVRYPRRPVDVRIIQSFVVDSDIIKNFELCVPFIERQGYIGLKV